MSGSNAPYDKCYKFLGDLTTQDWIAVGQKLGLNTDEFKSAHTKRQIIRLVYSRNKEWFKSWDTIKGKIYFFKFIKKSQDEETEYMNTSFDEPTEPESYVHKPAVERNFLTEEMLNSIFTEDEKSFVVSTKRNPTSSESSPTESAAQSTLQSTISPKNKSVFMAKLKYDPDTEINRFLSCVESYAEANGITSDKKIIHITTSCLNQSYEGALAIL